LATALSAYVIWRWFDLPQKMEETGALARPRLADARHETAEHTEPLADSVTDPASVDLESGRFSAVFAFGFGYSIRIEWRPLLYGGIISIALLAAWRVLHGSKPMVLAYGIVTAVYCFAIVGRLQGLLQRWMQTPAEQALLLLAPKCPDAPQIKRAVIGTTMLVQRGSVAVWLTLSLVATLMGLIESVEFLWGIVAVLGISLAFSGATWAVLAHHRIREWHLTTIAIVVTVCGGAAIILFEASMPARSWMIGAAMMALPPALALTTYLLAPLRFPLNVDPRTLSGARWI
jgi:hypothetical protein